MKHLTFLFVAAAAALVAPEQVTLGDKQQPSAVSHDVIQTWWDSTLSHSAKLFTSIEKLVTDSILSFDSSDDHPRQPPHHGHHHHPRGDKTKTIYELIKSNPYTTKFASLLENDDFSEIKDLLDSTSHNKTLFVPTDKAFERIPHYGDKPPPKKFVLAVLKYHISPGLHTARSLAFSNTLPTNLTLDSLGSHPQRLRVSSGLLFTIRLNLISKIVYSNILAKNGIIHAVDHLLLPPPPQLRILPPGTFSTFLLGLEKTGLGDEIPSHKGGTLFAPTNAAFQRLGPRANAFLFSDRGLKYLKALLKYHVVLGETLYSDAFYGKGGKDDNEGEEEEVKTGKYWHVDLQTLLDDKAIAVDVKSWRRWTSIVLNGFNRVVFQDGVANDGVVQVVGRVLIPPCEHHRKGQEEGGEMEVEELKERLGRFVEKKKKEVGDL